MKTGDDRSVPKLIKLDTDEKYTRLFSAKNGDAVTLRSGRVTLRENENIGEHSTGNSEEILIILEGRGELYISGSGKLDFERGAALYVPPNTIHDVKNSGRGLLKYVFVVSPIFGKGYDSP